jgi:hypothetical protein
MVKTGMVNAAAVKWHFRAKIAIFRDFACKSGFLEVR